MRRTLSAALIAAVLTAAGGAPALAQPADPAPLIAAQKEAMKPLTILDGTWRGAAWSIDRAGVRHDVTQTERVGSFLGGSVKVIEGRGYNADGSIGFNAFGIISFDPAKKTYSLRSYAMGGAGDFPVTVRPDGFIWEIPAGPSAVVRYTAVVKDGTWVEIGEYVAQGQPPRKFLEMNLKRIGDSDWPAAGPVPPK